MLKTTCAINVPLSRLVITESMEVVTAKVMIDKPVTIAWVGELASVKWSRVNATLETRTTATLSKRGAMRRSGSSKYRSPSPRKNSSSITGAIRTGATTAPNTHHASCAGRANRTVSAGSCPVTRTLKRLAITRSNIPVDRPQSRSVGRNRRPRSDQIERIGPAEAANIIPRPSGIQIAP